MNDVSACSGLKLAILSYRYIDLCIIYYNLYFLSFSSTELDPIELQLIKRKENKQKLKTVAAAQQLIEQGKAIGNWLQ